MRWRRVSSTRLVIGDARQNDRRTVGELGDKRQVPAHPLNRLLRRRQKQIDALLKPRQVVLCVSKPPRQAYLIELAGLAKLA